MFLFFYKLGFPDYLIRLAVWCKFLMRGLNECQRDPHSSHFV
jgi:hypothetical protein